MNCCIEIEQLGLRQEHYTTHPLLNLATEIGGNLRQKRVTVDFNMDIEKDFEALWIGSNLFKMMQLELT